jgi:hypothetical protein
MEFRERAGCENVFLVNFPEKSATANVTPPSTLDFRQNHTLGLATPVRDRGLGHFISLLQAPARLTRRSAPATQTRHDPTMTRAL